MGRSKVGPWRFALLTNEMPLRARYTALALSVFMDWQGMTYVSLNGLRDATHQGKATVHKYISWLEGEGWIVRESAGRGHRTYTYAALPSGLAIAEPPSGLPQDKTTPPGEVVQIGEVGGSIQSLSGSALGEPELQELQKKNSTPICASHTFKSIRVGSKVYRFCEVCDTKADTIEEATA